MRASRVRAAGAQIVRRRSCRDVQHGDDPPACCARLARAVQHAGIITYDLLQPLDAAPRVKAHAAPRRLPLFLHQRLERCRTRVRHLRALGDACCKAVRYVCARMRPSSMGRYGPLQPLCSGARKAQAHTRARARARAHAHGHGHGHARVHTNTHTSRTRTCAHAHWITTDLWPRRSPPPERKASARAADKARPFTADGQRKPGRYSRYVSDKARPSSAVIGQINPGR
jgi:hypothetical protein